MFYYKAERTENIISADFLLVRQAPNPKIPSKTSSKLPTDPQ